MLAARAELDTVLEPGDRLFVPKHPKSVSVIGEVLNPGALRFASGLEADDYIQMAGGLRRSADDARVFVVLPNGTARPVSLSAGNRTPVRVPRGSTIVGPKDPLPFDLFAFLRDTTEIVSRLAITAASLAVISDR
ncbi:MAG: SLBB domain-containing protein [Rhodospirillales bacterium]